MVIITHGIFLETFNMPGIITGIRAVAPPKGSWMERIGIVGAGTMGTGISQLFAEGGHEVILADIAEQALDDARAEIARNVRLAPL